MNSRSYYACRLPGEREIFAFAAEHPLRGITGEGFTIAPFSNDPDGIFTIPPEHPLSIDALPVSLSGHALPDTPANDHRSEILAIKEALCGQGKIVAARKITVKGTPDPKATFLSLCRAYPRAFVFLFHTPASGTWIGATPELLAEISGDTLSTMALAGTRPGGTGGPWDSKNMEEQQLVTEFIISTLSHLYREVIPAQTLTLAAGPVEHICTPITAAVPIDSHDLRSRVLSALSPTPAVCGSDRKSAIRLISQYEPDGRDYYGGYCGIQGKYFVTLRAARIFADGVTLYSGSGITPLSDPDAEWEETRIKAETLLPHLKFIEKR
ncbi:MAG: chorismate-binding protein [Muribaculaceae bacterium]|nr:chorismate-binding protein [Muribaculaceae bacterium]